MQLFRLKAHVGFGLIEVKLGNRAGNQKEKTNLIPLSGPNRDF